MEGGPKHLAHLVSMARDQPTLLTIHTTVCCVSQSLMFSRNKFELIALYNDIIIYSQSQTIYLLHSIL